MTTVKTDWQPDLCEVCLHCGHTGAVYHLEHVGGYSIDQRVGPFCQNRRECWKRWNDELDIPIKES